MDHIFAIKGQVCYSGGVNQLCTVRDGIIICENGVSKGVFTSLPQQYEGIPLKDYGACLIIPGLVDLHMHAPQYANRGLGLDLELLPWLGQITFPEEQRFEHMEYARRVYEKVVTELVNGPNTRVCLFATIHSQATHILMELLEKSGLKGMVGKVNMDRNAPEYIRETNVQAAVEDTRAWIEDSISRYKRVQPILTPRFTPAVSDELMQELSKLQKEYQLPVQSHLSENIDEIKMVKRLCKDTYCYGESYDRFGLFGGNARTVMAHCVHSSEDEIELMRKRGVYIAHCPDSNTNLTSGIAPIRRYLTLGLKVGLGSDISAGCHTSIFYTMAEAIKASKLYYRLVNHRMKPLKLEEVFYMATLQGGSFFGRVGSFEEGYEFDAVVLDDREHTDFTGREYSIRDRLEMAVYLPEECRMVAKYVQGRAIIGGKT